MLPVVALVGRPNVGKSTLFNRLTRSRDALVADYPGLTRDRQYGQAEVEEHPFIVIDTGGINGDEQGIDIKMAEQSLMAVEEADAVLFLVDARDGLTAVKPSRASTKKRTASASSTAIKDCSAILISMPCSSPLIPPVSITINGCSSTSAG